MTRHERTLRRARRLGDLAAIAILEGRLCYAAGCRRRSLDESAFCDAHVRGLLERVFAPRLHGRAA